MNSFGSIVWSSVGKKVITGITGLALMGFVTVHLIGNFTMFIGPAAFNGYAHFLETMAHGWLIYVMEAGMIVLFLAHMISASYVAIIDKLQARKVRYRYSGNAGGKSHKGFSSQSMIYTGTLLIAFVILHVRAFKFGDHEIGPDGVKNLYKIVVTALQDPLFCGFTVLVMVLLGFHLRHGFWSAFQSLGWANDKYLPLLTRFAAVFAILMAIGFVGIPIYFYFFGDPNLVAHSIAGGH